MTYQRQPSEFITGDLVYFVGYEGTGDATRLGIVKEVVVGRSHFPLYEIYWFRENYSISSSLNCSQNIKMIDLKLK